MASRYIQQDILDDYITYIMNKYGSKEYVIGYLNSYLHDGNGKGFNEAITKDLGLRAQFEKYMSPNFLLQIAQNNIPAFVNSTIARLAGENRGMFGTMPNVQQVQTQPAQQFQSVPKGQAIYSTGDDYTDKLNVFIDACKATFLKYNEIQVANAIYKAARLNDFSSFTNSEYNGRTGWRNAMMNYHITPQDIDQFVADYLTFYNYAIDVNNDKLNYSNIANLIKEEVKKELSNNIAK